jgi:hypothetical protein
MRSNRLSAAIALAYATTAAAGAAALAGLPIAAHAEAPKVTWRAPLNNATISGTISGSACAADATSSVGMQRTVFWIGGMQINNDYSSPWNCSLDTRKLRDGAYTMRVDAYSAKGELTRSSVNVTIKNSTTSTSTSTTTTTTATPTSTTTTSTTSTSTSTTSLPAPTSGTLDVWFKAPLAGATVSGTLSLDKCYVKGSGVARVNFFVDGKSIGSDTNVADGMSCTLDTRTLANGTHQLMATAVSSTGATRSDVISINVQNTSTTSTPTTPTTTPTTTTATTSNLPTGGSIVPTFHSLGLYFKPASNPGSAGCTVRFRKTSESTWRNGLNLWYDSRNAECRGSLVQLDPGTQYEVQFGTGSTFTHKQVASTWAESFPVAQTITLPAGTITTPLNITQGGSAGGYVLYQANPNGTTIDVGNAHDNNVTISAPYVIVRGVTMRNARVNGVELRPGAHHVVIERNDISGWGRRNYVNSSGWEIGVDMDSGIRARCGTASSVNTSMNTFIVQRNRIHDPRYGANSWDWGHPAGPQGVTFSYCGGNHVIRYNEITSSNSRKYFNDAISGEDNFTNTGFPHNDSDIYGNLIQGAMDDGIEAEGGNRNVRIWGNYLNQTGTGIASTVVATGPLYVFRNVYNQSRKRYLNALDSDDRGPFFKAGGSSTLGYGRRYVFHNTALQASGSGAASGLGAGLGIAGNTGQPLANTVTRNNIFHIWKGTWPSINQTSGGTANDVNYDLYNGNLDLTGEANGMKSVPQYASGHGPASGSGGYYQLSTSSAGYDRGVRLPNFNDDFLGAAPDMGAAETGKPPMKFGIQ